MSASVSSSSVNAKTAKNGRRGLLTLGALGVVYGDIGTSPLYTVREILHGSHEFVLTNTNIYGGISLVFWSLVLVVCLKYVLVIMRASNQGEGGIFALMSLVESFALGSHRRKAILIGLGLLGAALFYGDALITPAISVLSAVEGLEVAAPSLSDWIVPITIAILIALFAVQRFGTKAVGGVFGPVMVVWFTVLAVLGIVQIAGQPEILQAVNPIYGVRFFIENGLVGFLALGSVVLAVTGAEALYADMGHFGRRPISRAWFGLVLPALAINYFGQGALLLDDPSHIENPFFHLAPSWGEIPLVVLASVATVIASQAVISGAFSLTRQAMRLGVLPLLNVRHTSRQHEGQIYIPAVNWMLLIAIIAIVLGFGSSGALAEAYGLAVTGTFITSTILVLVVARKLWDLPTWSVAAIGSIFVLVDSAFFIASLAKVPHGGWFSLAIAAALFVVLSTWRRGQAVLRQKRLELEGSLQQFVDDIASAESDVQRVPGTAVFLSANDTTAPLALRYNLQHNRVLHENVVIVTVSTERRPHVPEQERVTIDDLRITDDGIVLIKAAFGYSDTADVPRALQLAVAAGLDIDVNEASYFITRSIIKAQPNETMAMWRKQLFIAINRNSGSPTRYFRLPETQVVSMGSTIII